MKSCILFFITANSVQILQEDTDSFEYEPTVVKIMNQIDQMFKLLEKSSHEGILYGSLDERSQRSGFYLFGFYGIHVA